MNSIKVEWASLIIGIIFLILSSIIVFAWPINTGMQYWLTRIFISLGIALVFTGIFKTSIQAKINMPGLMLTASGSLAIFFILYFFNPIDAPQYNQNSDINRTTNINNNINNNINLTTNNSSDFIRPFIVEKKLNTPLLEALIEKEKSFKFINNLSANPIYLKTGFLESFNIYQEVKDEKILNELIELLTILNNINAKIKNLNEGHKKMIYGNIREMMSAQYDFLDVSEKAEKAIFLYANISSFYQTDK